MRRQVHSEFGIRAARCEVRGIVGTRRAGSEARRSLGIGGHHATRGRRSLSPPAMGSAAARPRERPPAAGARGPVSEADDIWKERSDWKMALAGHLAPAAGRGAVRAGAALEGGGERSSRRRRKGAAPEGGGEAQLPAKRLDPVFVYH